jgi:methyl-accepting chemotaxis protein
VAAQSAVARRAPVMREPKAPAPHAQKVARTSKAPQAVMPVAPVRETAATALDPNQDWETF